MNRVIKEIEIIYLTFITQQIGNLNNIKLRLIWAKTQVRDERILEVNHLHLHTYKSKYLHLRNSTATKRRAKKLIFCDCFIMELLTKPKKACVLF